MVVFIKKVFFLRGGQSSINVFTFCDLQKVNLQWEFGIKVLKCKLWKVNFYVNLSVSFFSADWQFKTVD